MRFVQHPLGGDGSGRPWFRAHPRWAVAVVVSLFAGVLATRLLVGDGAADAAGLLYTLPVALTAVAFGRRAGLGAGLVGVALVVLWAVVRDADISWLGWVSRVVPLFLLGALLGDATERLERAELRERELEAAAQRHRDAAEISDSLMQGMTAARWALEAERYDVALLRLEETIVQGQRLVSDLLREADLAPGRHLTPPRGRASD